MELNFDEERERLQGVRAELLNRVTVIENAIAALTSGSNGSAEPSSKRKAGGAPGSGMSAKARKAASDRMKAYWAKRRRDGRTK